METIVWLLAVYFVWQMTGGLPLQPPSRAVISAVGILLVVLILLLGGGLVRVR